MARLKKPEPEEVPSGTSITLDLIEELSKATDNAIITRMGDDKSVIITPKFLSTGLPVIDHMLGGGIPAGRITELFSKGEGLGKSSLAAQMMAEMLRQGGQVMLMDTEHGFTRSRLETFGINVDDVILVQPDYIEAACQTISDMIKSLKRRGLDESGMLIVWDSVTATPSKQEFEAEYGNVTMAAAARAWSANIKKLKDEIAKSEVYVVLINQTRQNINAMYGEKHQTTGGMAIKYYAGCRLVLYRGQQAWLMVDGEKKGFKVTMMTEKSRVAAPYREAKGYLLFDSGYDKWRALFDLLIQIGILQQKGAWVSMSGVEKSFQAKQFEEVIGKLDGKTKKALKAALERALITPQAISYFLP